MTSKNLTSLECQLTVLALISSARKIQYLIASSSMLIVPRAGLKMSLPTAGMPLVLLICTYKDYVIAVQICNHFYLILTAVNSLLR